MQQKYFIPERTITPRVADPLATATLMSNTLTKETRTTHTITGDLIRLHETLKPRWEAYKAYQIWQHGGQIGTEPTYEDETTGERRSGAYALAPSQVVNDSLNEFVGLTLKVYAEKKLGSIFRVIQFNEASSEAVQELRQIAIHAEEAMEQEALGLIFKAVANNPEGYKEAIENIVREKLALSEGAPLPDDIRTRTTLLEALVVDYPAILQQAQPERYQGMVFKYFDNYEPLIKSELKLLTTPFLLQNAGAAYFYGSEEEMLASNPGISSIIDNIRHQSASAEEADAKIKHFMDDFPEFFGMQHLPEKTFTFVGAGFPLTGILEHIQTGGASINLVDYDATAVENAKHFISICESLGITNKDAIRVIHADARDITYIPRQNSPEECSLHQDVKYVGRQKYVLPTDVLDLASALPEDVTRDVMEHNAAIVPIVRKRNVDGISRLLYEQYTLPQDSSFRLGGKVVPPQKVMDNSDHIPLVTDISDAINVNSDCLYVNTNQLAKKKELLEQQGRSSAVSQPNIPSSEVKEGGEIQWDQRTLSYYL